MLYKYYVPIVQGVGDVSVVPAQYFPNKREKDRTSEKQRNRARVSELMYAKFQ